METLRLSGFAFVLFMLAFAGISWATKGSPVAAMRATPAKQEVTAAIMRAAPAKPEAAVPAAEPAVAQAPRREREAPAATASDSDPRREALRLAALRAANDFALAPCDAAVKRTLVTALSAYARAWTEMAGCKSGPCGGDHKLDKAAGAFSTPADARVRSALRAAFDTGGISRDDFPPAIRLPLTMLVGDPGDPASACTTGRRAEAVQ